MVNYKEKIIDYCKNLSLNIIGFTKCRIFTELKELYENRKEKEFENEFEIQDIEIRINPFYYMEDGKTIISIAFPYLYDKEQKDNIYFSKYTLGKDYHQVLSMYLNNICEYIKSLGGKAMYFVDSNALPERHIAALSGMGFIGKNNMLITKDYGSYVFLGEIITNLTIEEDEPLNQECDSCNLCLRACPTKAISAFSTNNNSNVCLSYITQKKEIESDYFSKFNGRIFGCDTCQNVCPYNRDIQYSNIKEFKPFDFMKNVILEELIYLDNKAFREKYKNTSCGWRGKNIIIRNAIINKLIKDKNYNIEVKKISSPYLLEYINKLK